MIITNEILFKIWDLGRWQIINDPRRIMLQVNRYNQVHLGDKRGNTGQRLALPNSPHSHFLTFLDPMCPLAIPASQLPLPEIFPQCQTCQT